MVWGMSPLDRFIDDQLSLGRATFSRESAEKAVALKEEGLVAALVRLGKRKRIVSPHKGFYIILRPEDQTSGAPDPAQWIDPLMRYLSLDYRVSLLRAAALHGSSHQAAMVFQVVVPRQLRSFEIGRHRVQYLTQAEAAFSAVNEAPYLSQIKTNAGFAKAAGVELTLLDAARYAQKAGGMNGVAQIAMSIGDKADPKRLAQLAAHYETSCVRRLGYLLEHFHHDKQAKALEPVASKAKTAVLFDPSSKPLVASLADAYEKNSRWKLILNEEVEVDL